MSAKYVQLAELLRAKLPDYAQRSGYDSAIEYLFLKAQAREGMPDPAVRADDPLRERSIESGFAMRQKAQKFSLADLHQKPAKEAREAREASRRQRAANGEWFEQMDFLQTLENPK